MAEGRPRGQTAGAGSEEEGGERAGLGGGVGEVGVPGITSSIGEGEGVRVSE